MSRALCAALTLLLCGSFGARASADEARALVLWGEPAVTARFLGSSRSSPGTLRFEVEGVERVVVAGEILRFGGRENIRGGMVVGLDDGSQIVCQRLAVQGGHVLLRGGIFDQQRVPLEQVRSIVRRYPYDAAAADRLERELRAVERASDAVVTMSGEIVRVIVPRVGSTSAWRLGTSDLDAVDLNGDPRHFRAASIRGIVFGRPGGASQAAPGAPGALSVGFTDGSYLARVRFAESGSLYHANLPEEAFLSDAWAPSSICYVSNASNRSAGVTLLPDRNPVRYGVQSLFASRGEPLVERLTAEPLRPGLNESLDGLPIRIEDRQLPFGLAVHPASTAIYIVPSGAVLLGQLAQHDLPHPAEHGNRGPAAAGGRGSCRLTVAAGTDEATIRTVAQSDWIEADSDPAAIRIELGTARILVLSCESTSPATRPVLVDLRIVASRP